MFWGLTFNSRTIPKQSVSVDKMKAEAAIAMVNKVWCEFVDGGFPPQKAFSRTFSLKYKKKGDKFSIKKLNLELESWKKQQEKTFMFVSWPETKTWVPMNKHTYR